MKQERGFEMYFYDPQERTGNELLPGVSTRTFWGERMLISLVDLQPHAVIPSHSHSHEQVGIVVKGELTLTIEDQTRLCGPGAIYIVPGDTPHGVTVGDAGCQVFEVFSPVREEYKFPQAG